MHFPKLVIESGALKKLPNEVRPLGKHFVIITDEHLKKTGEQVLKSMRDAMLQCNLLVIPPGENTKSLSFVEKISRSMAKLGVKRDGCVIALGGGVIGDLAGFVASVYMRGIPFVTVPTTLLAMGDSGIGGKTGVDLPEGKNLVGSFHQPKIILVDTLLLRTLPDRDFRSGLAEIVKHGVIVDRAFFTLLERNTRAIMRRDQKILKKIVSKSIHIKMNIVRKDEKESVKNTDAPNSRMLLNYGHTVGHALEKLSNYTMTHGEAIAIGMVAENRVAVGKKLLKEKDAERILNLLKTFKLPTKIPSNFTTREIKKALSTDKKNINGKLYFALPVRIGKAILKVL